MRTRCRGTGSSLARRGLESALGRGQRGDGDDVQQGRHPVQERFNRAGTGQMEEPPVLVLLDVRRHFAEGEDQRRGLSLG